MDSYHAADRLQTDCYGTTIGPAERLGQQIVPIDKMSKELLGAWWYVSRTPPRGSAAASVMSYI